MNKIKFTIVFFLILILASIFRFTGLNWDDNAHLHPDERFLTMVATSITWPKTIAQYFDTAHSPLNPHNVGYSFYVYGTYPVLLTKFVAQIVHMDTYDGITLVGRAVSTILEIGTVIFIFAVAKRITNNPSISLLASYLYALMVTPIQSAHYFTVDSYLAFFIAVCLFFMSQPPTSLSTIPYGIGFGLLLASKISGVYLLPIIMLGFLGYMIATKKYGHIIVSGVIFCVAFGITLRLAQPYMFMGPHIWNVKLNPKILANWKELEGENTPETHFPPALQWIPTQPYIYPFVHQTIWAIGLPIMGTAIVAVIFLLTQSKLFLRKKSWRTLPLPFWLLLLWTATLWGYQGGQFAKPLRYLYPVHGVMAVLFAIALYNALHILKLNTRTNAIIAVVFCGACAWWTWGVTAFYRHPQPRVEASEWILNNLPAHARIAYEHWDDPAPLHVPGKLTPENFVYTELPLYGDDDLKKWQDLAPKLTEVDYIIITSNRLWRSLSAIPKRYPYTKNYYSLLSTGKLGFTPIQFFSSYPCLIPGNRPVRESDLTLNTTPPPISITNTPYCLFGLNDDGAEESFTVYDHPKVLIYQNTDHFTSTHLYNLVTSL